VHTRLLGIVHVKHLQNLLRLANGRRVCQCEVGCFFCQPQGPPLFWPLNPVSSPLGSDSASPSCSFVLRYCPRASHFSFSLFCVAQFLTTGCDLKTFLSAASTSVQVCLSVRTLTVHLRSTASVSGLRRCLAGRVCHAAASILSPRHVPCSLSVVYRTM
jgi:hypothetical protein